MSNNNLLHLFPFSLPYGGYVYRATGTFVRRSSGGYFWASGAYSGVFARSLSFTGADVWPENGSYKTSGFSVRCLAKIVFLKKTQFVALNLSHSAKLG
ncbi:hypothetical protein IKF94_03120 [Candidatus Saccharibacteria bacterium]|nr:hypothetical protein [Candidatus Saccharibacteria bacterium]